MIRTYHKIHIISQSCIKIYFINKKNSRFNFDFFFSLILNRDLSKSYNTCNVPVKYLHMYANTYENRIIRIG